MHKASKCRGERVAMHKGDRPPPTSFLPPESWGSCGGSLTHHKLSVKSTSQSSSLSLLCQQLMTYVKSLRLLNIFESPFSIVYCVTFSTSKNSYPTVPWCIGCIKVVGFQWTWCGVNPVIGNPPLHPPLPLHSTQHHILFTWIGWTGSNISAPTWHQINMYLSFNQNFMTAPIISQQRQEVWRVSKASWWQQIIFEIKTVLLHL